MMMSLDLSDFSSLLEGISVKDVLSVDDDITQKMQSNLLPLEIQLMLVPMWGVRSDYYSCMQPLDKAMEEYMNFRDRLLEIDQRIELRIATNTEILSAFDQVLSLYNIYEKNQLQLYKLMKEVNHQLQFYSHATKTDLMWNEMVKLKDVDYISFTRRTCCFEHVVVSLFKLDESIKDSIQTSKDISRCCANYLVRIAQNFTNFPCSYKTAEMDSENDDKSERDFGESLPETSDEGSDFDFATMLISQSIKPH